MVKSSFCFNFGPISRTLGEPPDYVGFASLPIHEITTALLGARNPNELIAWLWHDTFKALFTWELNRENRPSWRHLREKDCRRLAQALQVDADLVLNHHNRDNKMIGEPLIVTNEFEQLYLGEQARFVQLSFKCQPAASTLVLRLAIAEAFLQALSKVVGKAIAGLGLPFKRVNYVFDQEPGSLAEDQIAAKYDMRVQGSTLEIIHWVPSAQFGPTRVQMDLTGAPPDRNKPQVIVIGLSELLTVYRDDLTIIAGLPLFISNADQAIEQITRQMRKAAPKILQQLGIPQGHRRATVSDLLQVIIDEQIELRLLDERSNEPRNSAKPKKALGKAVHKLIARPYELTADASLTSRCIVCGSPIRSGKDRYFKCGKKLIEDVFSGNFADIEYVSVGDDVCPMCLIYANSAEKRVLRGSLAILTPSTSLQAPAAHRLIEQPRFDQAGRFDPSQPMVKTAMTLQELILLTLLSRRILSGLVTFDVSQGVGPIGDVMMPKVVQEQTQNTVVGKYLPYSGAYYLFDITAVNRFYRAVFLGQEQDGVPGHDVWQQVRLAAYPFEISLSPSFTMLLELRQNADFMAHARAHTLLKVQPSVVHLSPRLAFHVLVDNAVQEVVDKDYVDTLQFLNDLASASGANRYEFIKALLSGNDPITATYETVEPRQKGRKSESDLDSLKMSKAKQMAGRKEVMGHGSPEELWATFVEQSEKIRAMCQAHPTLTHFLQKPKKRGG